MLAFFSSYLAESSRKFRKGDIYFIIKNALEQRVFYYKKQHVLFSQLSVHVLFSRSPQIPSEQGELLLLFKSYLSQIVDDQLALEDLVD